MSVLNYVWLSLMVWTSYGLCERVLEAERDWVGYSQISIVIITLIFISLLCPIGRTKE